MIDEWYLCPAWFPKVEEIRHEITTAKYVSKFFTYNLFNPHNTPMKQALFLTPFYRWKSEAQRGKIICSNVVSRWSWDKDSVILDPSASKTRLVKIDIWVHSHGEQFIKLRLGRKHGNEVNSKCKNQLLEKIWQNLETGKLYELRAVRKPVFLVWQWE